MRTLTVIGAACLTALAAAPAAGAHHSASATASLTLEPLGSNCRQDENAPRSRCNGSRVARVDWSVTCGAESAIVNVEYLAARPGGRAPVGLQTVEIDTPGLSGVRKGASEPAPACSLG